MIIITTTVRDEAFNEQLSVQYRLPIPSCDRWPQDMADMIAKAMSEQIRRVILERLGACEYAW